MASPPEITCTNLSGKFRMNKALSDSNDAFFSLQGIGWLTRKAINMATVVISVKQYEKDGVVHIDIASVAAGLSETHEARTLDWSEREHKDQVFGQVKGRSRAFKKGAFEKFMEISDDDVKFILGEQLKDGKPSAFLDDDHIQSVATNSKEGWTADQVWGFEEVDGARRYTRRAVCLKGKKVERMRVVYDYEGPLDS